MIVLTAIIESTPEGAETMAEALRDVVAHVRAEEPETIGYHVARDPETPTVFTTFERYTTREAMERHNASPAVARFFEIAKPLLAKEPVIVVGEEFARKD